MKIAIDCADLDHSRIDGTRVYLKNLLNWFGMLDEKNQFLLYHQTDFNPELAPRKYPNYTDKVIPYSFWWTQTRLAYELLKEKPDVCWMPIQQLPYLVANKIKTVVTIHDLAFKFFPQYFPAKDRIKLNLFTDFAIQNADQIIAVSKSTKQDIIKWYSGIDPEKIKVVYHGFEKERFEKKNIYEEILTLKKQHGLGIGQFLLYVGAIQPRKDLITLVKAFEKIKNEPEYLDLKLVVVGEAAWQAKETLNYINNSTFKSQIKLIGKVSFEDLSKWYQAAEVFVMPSLYEGFGLPILEAMASDTPVVVADNSSLSEIGGQAVEKFITGKFESLAVVLRKILKSDNLKAALQEKGRKRVECFSWQKCAQDTLQVLYANADN